MPDTGSQSSFDEEQRAVLATLQRLFDAMANHDEEAMRETLIPDGAAVHSRSLRDHDRVSAASADKRS